MRLRDLPDCETYEDLVGIRQTARGSILAAFDLENIDHPCDATTPLQKLSEVGLAVLDTTKLSKPFEEATFQEIASKVQARHNINAKWAWVTPKTCPSNNPKGWHSTRNKPHVADPYNCHFANSRIVPTSQESMDQAMAFIIGMTNWAKGKQAATGTSTTANAQEARKVNVLFWSAGLEKTTIEEHNPGYVPAGTTEFHDLQQWEPIKFRWTRRAAVRKSQPSCADLLRSLGLGSIGAEVGVSLHNACNDAVMELLAYLRILKLTEAEWDQWIGGRDLSPIKLNICNNKAYAANQALEKKLKRKNAGRRTRN